MQAAFTVSMFTTLLLASAYAVQTDLLCHRIPNRLTGSLLFGGLALQVIFGGWAALGQATLGVLVGLAILMPLYVVRATGAGDLKLLAATGALLGPYWTVVAGAYTLVAGGALALGYVAWRATSAAIEPAGASWPLRLQYARERAHQARRERFPYALAIAAGAISAAAQRGDLQVAFDYLTGVRA